MESFSIQHLTFTYPEQEEPVLSDISLSIHQGEFVTLCGKSGCGKSTLLKHLKTCFTPAGRRQGRICFEQQPLELIGQREQSEKIGFVLQNPESQIVTDKVWHELAFGLESLGYDSNEIRTRVAEMASFFGIQNWFHKKTSELSGGQKQILNLAAAMAMQPAILILDEPTSQLDPIAAQDFLETIAKINRELGTTILLTEHRLEEAFPLSDRVVVMDQGRIIANGSPYEVGECLKKEENEMFMAFPVPMRIYAKVPNPFGCPITVREGRRWLEKMDASNRLKKEEKAESKAPINGQQPLIELREISFRYGEKEPDVIRNLQMKIYEGELLTVVGGNGTGKTTMLSIIGGILQPYRGKLLFKGRVTKGADTFYRKEIGVLPQNPQTLFVKNTVLQELQDMLTDSKKSQEEKRQQLNQIIQICELQELLKRHPYDLSGGEQQRAALAKVLLRQPQILLLDEPTKGMDACYKEKLAQLMKRLREKMGMTIVMVSHDIEFCAQYASRCAMFFDGNIVSEDAPRPFFSGKRFYTTAANRMAREKLPEAIIPQDVIQACNGLAAEASQGKEERLREQQREQYSIKKEDSIEAIPDSIEAMPRTIEKIIDPVTAMPSSIEVVSNQIEAVLDSIEIASEVQGILQENEIAHKDDVRRRKNRIWLTDFILLGMIPFTIYAGVAFWGDRKYYFISLLIIIETFIPFMVRFEDRRPQARELIIISVLCAIGVAGRTAFFMIPQFKPVAAIVIISAVCFGGETGFLIGAVTAFVSNIFFGQGPWTPWQMFAFGMIGFLAGSLYQKNWLKKSRFSLCVFGGLVTFLLYGGIMNTATVIIWQERPNFKMFISAYLMGVPFDLIHAGATVIFLFLIARPMIDKIERIKVKYELLEVHN